MSELVLLGADAVSLLCSLLEAEEPVITGYAVELLPMAATPLIEQGLLVPAGYDDVIGVETDGQEELVSVFPIDDDSALGYLDRYAGFVRVPPERLLRRRVDVSGVLRRMTSELDLPVGSPINEISPGLVWEIPAARLGASSSRRPLWFARRLFDPAVVAHITAMMERRPQPAPLIILTSTPAGRDHPPPLEGAIAIFVRDVLRDPDDLALHAGILERRLSGLSVAHDPALAVWLSADAKTIRFRCGTEIHFRGAKQIAILRTLKSAYDRGQAVRVKELTMHGGIAKVFGPVRWQQLAPFLEQRPDGWTFKR
ncbi:hypothetical protein [Neoroseomonas lacus]|uniref:Uncharacterized protein n=1 Tax=Neoroseomonas lacus TaxID=287609 RepID=A0A917NZT5_9PROT|nr:hypothetical protein [Neoroseomonas lacus]GGJ45120.1 hypothetical protein GCM10011320_60670 [Neoroseomonas lacus]